MALIKYKIEESTLLPWASETAKTPRAAGIDGYSANMLESKTGSMIPANEKCSDIYLSKKYGKIIGKFGANSLIPNNRKSHGAAFFNSSNFKSQFYKKLAKKQAELPGYFICNKLFNVHQVIPAKNNSECRFKKTNGLAKVYYFLVDQVSSIYPSKNVLAPTIRLNNSILSFGKNLKIGVL